MLVMIFLRDWRQREKGAETERQKERDRLRMYVPGQLCPRQLRRETCSQWPPLGEETVVT